MFYSNMGFRDNIKALYDYLLENNYNDHYKIICSVSDYKRYKEVSIKNVSFVGTTKGFLYYFKAGFVFYSFGKLPITPNGKQEVVQLWHGGPYKAPDEGQLKGHSWKRQYYTRFVSSSRHFIPLWSYSFSIPENKIIVTGLPRNDIMYRDWPKYNFGDYKKLILWTPTFRKSTKLGYENVETTDRLIPIIQEKDFAEVNSFLKSRKVKMVVKLHPMQNLNAYHLTDLDYLVLLSHQEFTKRGMDLYKFMPQCDAMITDYSTIFYDYLLLDRPIGFTEDDLKEYADKRGFIVDDPQAYKPGMRIRSIDDLYKFIEDIANGIDEYKADRDRVNGWANDYRDGKFCERVLNSVGICKQSKM
jgi:CDP-glycerol glycerophosphotransferase (TagB/SpsB family)